MHQEVQQPITNCTVMIFLHTTTISLIKLIFYSMSRSEAPKAVDLKLQDRIRRNNSSIRYVSPKRVNETMFVLYYLSSRPKVFCKKGVLRKCSKLTGKTLCWSIFLIKLQGWGLQLYYKEIPARVLSREFCEIV